MNYNKLELSNHNIKSACLVTNKISITKTKGKTSNNKRTEGAPTTLRGTCMQTCVFVGDEKNGGSADNGAQDLYAQIYDL